MKNQETFKIEDGIPIPPKSRATKYSWDKMKVGQSILVKCSPRDSKAAAAANSASSYGKRHGIRFQTRTEKDGLRIWRVE